MLKNNNNKIFFDIENLTFKELLNNSTQYHNNLLADLGTYDTYLTLNTLHKALLCGIDKKITKTFIYTTLNEIENSNKISFFEKHLIECIKDIKIGSTKESLISIEYQNALTYQIQYLISKAFTEHEKLEFIEFLSTQLNRHFKVYDNQLYDGKNNYFFLNMFFAIHMFMANKDIGDIILYKNFCINLDKKYPNID
jgi:hypothetical protein